MKKLFIMLIIIFVFNVIGYGKDKRLLSYNDNKRTYSFNGYAIKDNNFIISLRDNRKRIFLSYKYWQSKLIRSDIDDFESFEITKDNYDYWKIIKEDLFPNNETIQKYCSQGIKIDDSKYIILFDKSYYEPELNIFDGKTFKIIKMGSICVELMGEFFLYYEKEYKNLYFSGYKKDEKNAPAYDIGLYVYNLKTGKARLLEKAKDDHMLIAPYRIPGTDKLIFINNHQRYCVKDIYIREIEK